MAQPAFKVEIAFASGPLDTAPTWTDVTSQVANVRTDRGRQHELYQMDPGSAVVTVYNNDGAFSPWNTASAYYHGGTGLVPMKPIRISATYSGTTYQIWRGFVQSFTAEFPSTAESTMVLQCYDALSFIDQFLISDTGYSNAVLANTPTAYWQLNDPVDSSRALDSSGNGNHALPENVTFGQTPGALTASTTTAANFGRASGGTGGYLKAPSSLKITDNTQPFTFEAWILISAVPTAGVDDVYIAQQGVPPDVAVTGTSNDWYVHVDTSGKLNFYVGNNTVTAVTLTTPVVADGAWHYIYCVYQWISGTSYSLTVGADGTSQTTTYVAATLPTFNGADGYMYIGGTSPSNPAMYGQLDEVALYKNFALSSGSALTRYQLGKTPGTGDTTGTRVGRVLDLVGWPSSARSLDTGNTTLQSITSAINSGAGTYIQSLMDTENGSVYADPSGNIVFHERHKTLTGSYLTSQVTLGESEEPYELDNTQMGIDPFDIYNVASVQRENGNLQVSEDLTSQTTYGPRTYSKTGLLMTTDEEAQAFADWVVAHYKDPVSRVPSIQIHPLSDIATLGPQCFTRDLQDRVTVVRRQPGATAFNQDLLIEGISHDINGNGDWVVNWRLSPADTQKYWVLGTSTLGTDTRLSY